MVAGVVARLTRFVARKFSRSPTNDDDDMPGEEMEPFSYRSEARDRVYDSSTLRVKAEITAKSSIQSTSTGRRHAAHDSDVEVVGGYEMDLPSHVETTPSGLKRKGRRQRDYQRVGNVKVDLNSAAFIWDYPDPGKFLTNGVVCINI